LSTFVSVGNATQPFPRLLGAVAAIADSLPQPVVVQHGSGVFQGAGCDARSFVDMAEFEQRVATAELLIMHAGAGSVINAVRAGKVPVVMPRRSAFGEILDDHQIEFALALEQAGRVVVVDEPSELAGAVRWALELQRSGGRRDDVCEMARLVGQTLENYARRVG
jgi:UDP-N-acetylglucosamine transferase subunit ALG13